MLQVWLARHQLFGLWRSALAGIRLHPSKAQPGEPGRTSKDPRLALQRSSCLLAMRAAATFNTGPGPATAYANGQLGDWRLPVPVIAPAPFTEEIRVGEVAPLGFGFHSFTSYSPLSTFLTSDTVKASPFLPIRQSSSSRMTHPTLSPSRAAMIWHLIFMPQGC